MHFKRSDVCQIRSRSVLDASLVTSAERFWNDFWEWTWYAFGRSADSFWNFWSAFPQERAVQKHSEGIFLAFQKPPKKRSKPSHRVPNRFLAVCLLVECCLRMISSQNFPPPKKHARFYRSCLGQYNLINPQASNPKPVHLHTVPCFLL